MAITQSRMIALLHAARDYEHAYTRLIDYIQSEAELAKSGRTTIAAALTNITNISSRFAFLTDPIASAKSIALEAAHFTDATQRRNAKVAERQRATRHTSPSATRLQRQGIITPTTAPASLYPQYRHNPSPFETSPTPQYSLEEDMANPTYQKYLKDKALEEAAAHRSALRAANPDDDIADLDEDIKSMEPSSTHPDPEEQ